MKHLTAAILMTAMTALSVPFAIAAGPAQAANPEPAHEGNHRQEFAQHRAEHMQKNLDALQQQLHLKDNQQAGWAQYKSVAINAMSEHIKAMESHREHAAEGAELESTPARIQHAVALLRERADKLEKLGKQTETFYKTLTPEQQTIFDLHWKNHPAHHRG